MKTRGQAGNKLWKEERTKRITASKFGEICKAGERRDKSLLASSIIMPKIIKTAAIMHGIKYESVAVKKYEEITKTKTTECGLFVSSTIPVLAATPDRVVDGDTILEVKCPYVSRDKEINSTTVPYIQKDKDCKMSLDSRHPYYFQVQGQ